MSGRLFTLCGAEDAARLGYDNAASWRALLRSKQADFREAMQIPPSQLRWYAAFHDEGEHPHIHMMLWSDDPSMASCVKTICGTCSLLTNTIYAMSWKATFKKIQTETTQSCEILDR